jgi:parvulin-like peptidyl-prolyl isomerase
MLLRSRSVAALIAAILLAAGCRQAPVVPPDVVVSVGERMVTTADFDRYVERNAGSKPEQLAPEAASALLDQYVEEILLSEYAAAQGIQFSTTEVTEAVRNESGSTIVEKTDELRRQRLLADLSAKIPPPTEEDVRRFYQANVKEFTIGEQVHARQILVMNEDEAKKVEAELKGGTSFEDLSAKYSRAPNADRGGDIGFVGRGQLPKTFEDVLFSLKPGMVSPVIRTNSNYFHVFKVDAIRPAGMLTLEQARPLVVERLSEEQLRKAMDDALSTAAKETAVKVFPKRLKFTYSGRLSKAAE